MNDVHLGNIEIIGLSALEQKLMKLPDTLAKNILQDAIKQGAKVIQKQCIEFAPKSIEPHLLKSYSSSLFKNFKTSKSAVWVLPGNLKRMIRVKVDNSKSRGYKITYEVYVKNKEAWYWKFVEFGTSKMIGRTFMRSGFEMAKVAAIATVEERIKLGIESQGL